jgi:MFS family permease
MPEAMTGAGMPPVKVDVSAGAGLLMSEADEIGAAHYRILALCWAGRVFDRYDLVLFTFLAAPIARSFHLTRLQISWALGVSLGACALGGIAFGALADQYGRRRVLEWTIVTYSLGTLLCGVAGGLWTLLVYRAITGVGVGGEWATGHTYIGETFPPAARGRYAATLESGAAFGAVLASLMGGLAAPRIGWRACFFISAAPAVLSAFVRRALPESDVWLQKHPEARRGRMLAPPPLRDMFKPIASVLEGPHREDFIRSVALCTLDVSAFWIAFSWLPTYFKEERHLAVMASAAIVGTGYAASLAGCLLFGWTTDKIGRRGAFSVFSILMAAGLAGVTVLWKFIAGAQGLEYGAMIVTGIGSGMLGGYGPLFTELFPTSMRNSAMGGAYNLARGTQLFTPTLVAVIARSYGLDGGIVLAAGFALATGLFIWTFPETSKRLVTEVE